MIEKSSSHLKIINCCGGAFHYIIRQLMCSICLHIIIGFKDGITLIHCLDWERQAHPACRFDCLPDFIRQGQRIDPRVDVFAIALLVIFGVQAVFNYVRSYNLAIVGEGVVSDLRRAVFDRIVRLPVPFFDERHTGDLTSRLTSDVVTVQGIVADALGRMLSQGITLVGGVILAIAISPILSLSILTFLPIWNSYLWPLMVTRGVDVRPLTVGIQTFFGQDPRLWGDLMAFASMITIPVLIVFLLFQKWFVQSVASTGIKG